MSETGSTSTYKLLDVDGDMTGELENCLKYIFSKYCTPSVSQPESGANTVPNLPAWAFFTPQALDKWAIDTNGEPFPEETKEEVAESFDTTDDGNLTFKGFLQLYQLQTSNDEQETWKDLEKHGFDRNLELKKLKHSA